MKVKLIMDSDNPSLCLNKQACDRKALGVAAREILNLKGNCCIKQNPLYQQKRANTV